MLFVLLQWGHLPSSACLLLTAVCRNPFVAVGKTPNIMLRRSKGAQGPCPTVVVIETNTCSRSFCSNWSEGDSQGAMACTGRSVKPGSNHAKELGPQSLAYCVSLDERWAHPSSVQCAVRTVLLGFLEVCALGTHILYSDRWITKAYSTQGERCLHSLAPLNTTDIPVS